VSTPKQVIIFGASGDLTRRKLVPALSRLNADHVCRDELQVIGVSRSDLGEEGFRERLARAIEDDHIGAFDALAPEIHYHRGDASDPESLRTLSKRLDELAGGQPTGRIFYLSLSPELFAPTVARLSECGLLSAPPGESAAWRRVVIEKPFGHDYASAESLNQELLAHLREDQIYRIDHYLGKETVQNLLGFRFHNSIFEPLWNRHHVECVQITAAESVGVENGRGGYYDGTGALRDMLQNHLLQVLALVTMEPPSTFDAESIRNHKLELLRGLRHPDAESVRKSTVRGQYLGGEIEGKPVIGYREEEGVATGSQTETYVAVRAHIDNWRWAGVPFFMRHGKRLAQRFTEVKVQFRTPPVQLFNRPEGMNESEYHAMLRDGHLVNMRPNVLTLRLQPRESIELTFGVKQPGPSMVMAPAVLEFDYRERFGEPTNEAYERLLLDALHGDQTLFLRGDEIQACWLYADQVLNAWGTPEAPPLLGYKAGSWGPTEANALFGDVQAGWSRG
jgi:glucose-6-phosphate 1-dehydrogenase